MKHTRAYYEDYKLSHELLHERTLELELADQNDDMARVEYLKNAINGIRARINDITEAIDNYVPPDCPDVDFSRRKKEQLFLYNYYILGKTMDATAEAMDVSRDTVYRIKRRLLGGKR